MLLTGLVIFCGLYTCWFKISSFLLHALSYRKPNKIIGVIFVIGSAIIFLFLQQGVKEVYKPVSDSFVVIIFTVILSAIYALMRPCLDFAKRNNTNVDDVEQNDRGSFANKIVKYLE